MTDRLEAKKPDVPIPPGGQGTVELAFTTTGREGPFFHEALLETNDPLLPIAKLKATGYIDTGVTALPGRVEFGDVAVGEERTVACIVKYAGLSEEFAIDRVSCDSALVQLRDFRPDSANAARLLWPDAQAEVVGHAVRHVFVVTLRPTREQIGDIRANVTIQTNADGFESVLVPIVGRVVPPVRLYPSTLSFGEITAGDGVERTISALSPLARPFRIVGTLPQRHDLKVTAEETNTSNGVELSIAATGAAALALAEQDFALEVEMTDIGERFAVPLQIYALDADRRAPRDSAALEPEGTESGG